MSQNVLKIETQAKDYIHYSLSAHNGFHFVDHDDSYIYFKIKNYSGCEDSDFTMYGIIQKTESMTIQAFDDALILSTNTSTHTLSISLSFLSFQQAIHNFKSEDKSFKDFLQSNQSQWLHYFNKFNVKHSNRKELETFSNMLYRTFLFPMRFYEMDQEGNPYHYNTSSKKTQAGILYTNNGFWDTYKTVYPLLSLVASDMVEEMLEGFLNSYRNTGYLPKWLSPDERGLMPGTLIDAVIADACVKNLAQNMMPELLEAMLKSATTHSDNPNYGRRAALEYRKYGYVPNSIHESVNQTLDNAYSDYCIAQVAKHLGNIEIYEQYINTSMNYRNLFDSNTGFMRGKDINGVFSEDFNPIKWGGDYTEGSAWQNSFGVYHDIQGLINLYPSNNHFVDTINELVNQEPHFDVGSYGFEIHEITEVAVQHFGQMAISNQPSFHIPYLFTYAKKPESSQVLLRHLMKECFEPSFNAYPGDEDNGSTSAWYIFNALGLYPLTPGSGEYVLGCPLLDFVDVKLSNGNSLKITTHENYNHKNFVAKRLLNGNDDDRLFVTHDEVMSGIEIESTLGIVPKIYSPHQDHLPFSISKEKKVESI